MWRESRRHVTFVAVALVIAACTNAEADGTSTTEQSTNPPAIETTTATAPPTTTTSEMATTTAEFTDTVGSPQALIQLVDEANANSRLAYGNEIPEDLIPDLTNANPAMAARGLYELEAAIVQTAPVDEWFDVLVYPGSPVSFQYLSDLQALSGNRLVATFVRDGYAVHDTHLAAPSDLKRLPQEVQSELPDGSEAVIVISSSGPIDYVDADGVVAISNDGWSNRSRLVVVAPTDSGWKLYWTEDV